MNTPRFGNLLEGLTRLSICSHTHSCHLLEGKDAKLVKGKVQRTKERKPGKLPRVLSQWSHTECT